MIAPTFHINILKSFMDVFNQNSVNVVNKMREEAGKTFDVHDYMSEVTVDILLGKYPNFWVPTSYIKHDAHTMPCKIY